MSAIRLLVLGAVRRHGRAHGYQVRNDLEFWGAHEWSNAKPGSIYHALKQMAKQGLLLAHDVAPSTVGGPPRTEYELTEAGEREYFTLLRDALLRHDQKIDVLTAGVGFIVDLPRAEAIALLKERVAALEGWRTEVTRHWAPPDGTPDEWGHISEIMKLWVHSADSGAEWTRGLIERLEGGAYVMAGEGERSVDVLPDGAPNPYAAPDQRADGDDSVDGGDSAPR
ncbi:PadR family transcriptional regulator [Streptomyces sp. NPDC005355]|uniref:PadR family transcriptional regulator n=1 Tax=Streptomyces sp. NPDC005355 TaxID=3157038 RepID=UPI00339E2CA4